MKIAFVSQTNSVGAWRYTFMLATGLKKISPSVEITVLYENFALSSVSREKFLENDIKLKQLLIPGLVFRNKFRTKFFNQMYHFLRCTKQKSKAALKGLSLKWNTEIKQYDALFYTWPFGIEAPNIDKPLFFIPHDFIFTHFFGHHCGNIYSYDLFKEIHTGLQTFVNNGIAITSSAYIADELKRTFPEYNKKKYIVYAPQLNMHEKLDRIEVDQILNSLDINFHYILFATNDMHHKNMGQAISAFYYVKNKYPEIKMLIVGYNTQGIRVACNSPYYCDHVNENQEFDILSLGMLSDKQFLAVLQSATLVLNTSFCEAACGSGLDAWNFEIPLAISNIPPYMQQLDFLKTKAETFNPRNALEIADAILRILGNPQRAKANAKISKEQLCKYTIEDFAKAYYTIFQEGIDKHKID